MGSNGEHQGTLPLSARSAELLRGGLEGKRSISLLVYHRHGAQVLPLHDGEPLVIGREQPADVVIADTSLSRQHARLTLEAGRLTIEDLDSTNGTRLRGKLVRRGTVKPGEQVLLGAVMVQPHAHAPTTVPVGLDGHEHFCQALRQELVRAKYFRRSAALVLLRNLAADDEQAHISRWAELVRGQLRPVDQAGLYSSIAVELLLPEADTADALDRAERILAAARAEGHALGCGIAIFPESATSTDGMLEATREAAQHASAETPIEIAATRTARSWTPDPQDSATGPVAESAAMKKVFDMVERLASSPIPVLLHGETGTGKEVVSRAIHERGPRRAHRLVCVNCGAIPTGLVESTLFGHERGAFTGAGQASAGVFGSVNGGTALLDEIGELPAAAQVALLRVLESKRVTRVGSSKEVEVDVRIIAATHRNLEAMCDEGSFRRDLLYRLNAMTLTIPALRERPADVRPLVARFLREACAAARRSLDIEEDALALLERYHWPGNLRELRNAIERAVVIAMDDTIGVDDLPDPIRHADQHPQALDARDVTAPRPQPPALDAPASEPAAAPTPPAASADDDADFKGRVQRYEAELIIAALNESDGNQTEAAKSLQMPLRTLVHKMKTYGVKKLGYGMG